MFLVPMAAKFSSKRMQQVLQFASEWQEMGFLSSMDHRQEMGFLSMDHPEQAHPRLTQRRLADRTLEARLGRDGRYRDRSNRRRSWRPRRRRLLAGG